MITIGMVHGALFSIYFVLSLFASHKQGWSVVTWLLVLLVLLAAIIPLAIVFVEIFVRKELRKN